MTRETNVMNPPAPGQPAVRLLMSRLRGMFEAYRQDRIRRDAFLNLLCLDDKILDDIGLTRAEVECAARLPLRVNASDVLAAEALARRKGQIGW